jgi:formate-dependent nitrite reductase membrane component NrfD
MRPPAPIDVADSPLIASQPQRLWDVPHAVWFTLMGVGGGIFLLSRLLGLTRRLGEYAGLPAVDLVSFAVIGVGGLVLIFHLGRPLRFARTLVRPGTSWISRGAIADFVFLVAGGVLILPGLSVGGATPFAWLPWTPSPSNTLGKSIEIVALISSAVVIFYAGQVLADSPAIPYWHSPAVPIQFVLSSLATSAGVVMLLETINGEPIRAHQLGLLLATLTLLLVSIVWHLRTGPAAPGKVESLALLLRGRLRRPFLGGVVGAGTVAPMILAAVGLTGASTRDAVGIACLLCTLPAGFALRLLTLRAGIYPPIHAAIPPAKR